jgi:hypothetical protein
MLQRFKTSAFARRVFFISPVTLGVCRVALALLLLVDVLRRWSDLDVWYTNSGLMPNHTMLWAPIERFGFSLFYSVSELHEARFFVLVIVVIYLLLLVGYRTRLMQVLALIAQVSLNCRVHYLLNGGDTTLSALLLWTAFLPLGDWLSVDAFLAKLRAARLVLDRTGAATLEVDPQQAERFTPPTPRFEWVAGALVAQLAVIYFFNCVHKDTDGWAEGRVILDVLHQDRVVTALGVLVRPYLTPAVSYVLTKATLVTEGGLPVLLLLPLLPVPGPFLLWVRRFAVLSGFGLHLGFALFLNVGVFQPTMLCLWSFLIPGEDLTRLFERLRGPRERVTVVFDATCGACTAFVKAMSCLQASSTQPRLLRFEGRVRDHEPMVSVQVGGRRLERAAALAEVLGRFVGLRPLAWLLRSPWAQRPFQAAAARRQQAAACFGFEPAEPARIGRPFEPVAPVRQTVEHLRARLAGAALMVVAAAFVLQVLVQNRAVPPALKPQQPFWVAWFVGYAHFYQGWGMFAVSPRTDGTVVVRARTVDGRLVDPLSERASPRSPPGLTAITDRLDHDEFFCDYLSKIGGDPPYHTPLRDWILAYPRRTGRPEDRIVSFEVVNVSDVSPWYGETVSTQTKEQLVFRYP